MARLSTRLRLTTRLAAVAFPLAALLYATPVLAAVVPSLGTAGNFAVLGGTAVTCTDGTIKGDVGVSPGTVVVQTNCPIIGAVHAGDSAATQANIDFRSAYAAFAALPCFQTLTTLNQTLAPGVYCFDAGATSTGGVLTLNGPPDGIWIFKIGTLGTGALTGTGFSVVTSSGAPLACNGVYWWVAEAATLTDSMFSGTILAGTAITLTRGSLNGRALAKAAVTVTGTSVGLCASTSGGGGGDGGGDDHNGNGGGDDHNGNGDREDHHSDGGVDDHTGDGGGDKHHGHHGSQED